MQIIPIASGKGGVGKSLLSANLAIALGQAGKKVVLADLDLGASNLHLALGQQLHDTSIGTYLTDKTDFKDIIEPTDYENVSFIAGDSQIPGLTALKATQKAKLVRNFRSIQTDYLILDLGAGTHQIILDLFLQSPQGILITSPAPTATLDGYLFIKNAVFRLLYTTFKKGTPGYSLLETLKKDSDKMKTLYVPRLTEALMQIDRPNCELFVRRMQQFRPRLVMNMIDNPKDAERATRIKNSCNQYLGMDIDNLGVLYRDLYQDKALNSRLPILVYKPQCVLSQAIYRIAQSIIVQKQRNFDEDFSASFFSLAQKEKDLEEMALEDYDLKLSGVEEMIASGQLTNGELVDMIKTQAMEMGQIRKENTLLKSKIVKACQQGFRV